MSSCCFSAAWSFLTSLLNGKLKKGDAGLGQLASVVRATLVCGHSAWRSESSKAARGCWDIIRPSVLDVISEDTGIAFAVAKQLRAQNWFRASLRRMSLPTPLHLLQQPWRAGLQLGLGSPRLCRRSGSGSSRICLVSCTSNSKSRSLTTDAKIQRGNLVFKQKPSAC